MRHGAALHVLLPLAGMIERLAHAAGSTPASANRALTTAAAVMDCLERPGCCLRWSHLHARVILSGEGELCRRARSPGTVSRGHDFTGSLTCPARRDFGAATCPCSLHLSSRSRLTAYR